MVDTQGAYGRYPGAFWGWLAVIIGGVGALVAAWTLLRPIRFTLDDEGFTLSGGLARRPARFLWTQVGEFSVHRPTPQGPAMASFNFLPGSVPDTFLIRLNRKKFGAEGAIPTGLAKSPSELVRILNGYRDRATRRDNCQ